MAPSGVRANETLVRISHGTPEPAGKPLPSASSMMDNCTLLYLGAMLVLTGIMDYSRGCLFLWLPKTFAASQHLVSLSLRHQ